MTYCTNALAAVAENSGQQMMPLPTQLAVGADYGLTVMASAPPQAYRFAMFILSAQGQRILLEKWICRTNRGGMIAIKRTAGLAALTTAPRLTALSK